ncbi:MAG: hypothetical protein AB7L09_22060 [Nitrospira sp.]
MAPIAGRHNACCPEGLPEPDPKKMVRSEGVITARCSECQEEYVQITGAPGINGGICFWRSYKAYQNGLQSLAKELKRVGWKKDQA